MKKIKIKDETIYIIMFIVLALYVVSFVFMLLSIAYISTSVSEEH